MLFFQIGAVLGVLLALGWYIVIGVREATHAKRTSEYFFSDWDLSPALVRASVFSSAMSLATVVIALVQLGSIFGPAFSWATITFCIGWLCFLPGASRVRVEALRRDTIHAFIGRAYESRVVTVVASIATIGGLLGLFATELFAADILCRAMGLPEWAGSAAIIVFGLAAIAHAALGGFRSVVRSDMSQSILLLIAILTLLFLASRIVLLPAIDSATPSPRGILMPTAVMLGLFMINVPLPFVDPLAWQRAQTAITPKAFFRGSTGSVAAFVITWTILIGIGAAITKHLPPGSDAFVGLLQSTSSLSPPAMLIVGVLLFPGFVAAMLSSADAFLNASVQNFCLDLTALRHQNEDGPLPSVTRIYVGVLGLVGLVFTVSLKVSGFSIVDLIFAVYAGTLGLFPSVVTALFLRNRLKLFHLKYAALTSIVCGFAAAWANGFYSVLGPTSSSALVKSLNSLVPMDVYQSPTYAFVASVSVFLIMGLIEYVSKKTSNTSSAV